MELRCKIRKKSKYKTIFEKKIYFLMDTKDNLLIFIKEKNLSKTDFYRITGLSNGFLDKKGSVTSANLETILKFFPELSADWLITGKGPMYRSALPAAHPATEPGAGIPLIPINAMAGAFTDSQVVLELECERYVVPVFKEAEFLITVKGSSMIPKYNSGDIVACKRMPLDTFFQWNKVYVLDTEQGPLIKRVKKGTTDETLTIFSDNPKYEPFELPRTKIYHIALVVGVIRLE
jgi:phage repressor protein C with HTH and peptisase S24 domain